MSLINNKYFCAIAQLPRYIRCRWIQWLDVYESVRSVQKQTEQTREQKWRKKINSSGREQGMQICFAVWTYLASGVEIARCLFFCCYCAERVYCFPDDRSIHCDCVHRKRIYFSRVFISMHDKFTFFFLLCHCALPIFVSFHRKCCYEVRKFPHKITS